MATTLLIAKNAPAACELLPGLANRHGLITGATGTGKTVTLQKVAEEFPKIGTQGPGRYRGGPRGGKHEGLAEAMARSAVRTIGGSVAANSSGAYSAASSAPSASDR